MKVQPYSQRDPATGDPVEFYGFLFWCPGCEEPHSVSVKGVNSIGKGPWTFNGDMNAPTFGPSVLLSADDESSICHSFVEGGNIRFLTDCIHALAGQTVPIPDWTEDTW